MYFTKSLLTLLASTTLTTLVTSTPIDSKTVAARNEEGAKLVARFPNFDQQVQGSAAAWQALTTYCGSGGSSKRDIESRATPPEGNFNEVTMGDSQSLTYPIRLWTQNLLSCIGIGVTADQGRALGHFTSDESSKEAQWDKFSGLVSGWTNIQGFVSQPDRSTNTSPIMTTEALDLMDRVSAALIARVGSLGPTRPVLRSMAPGTNTDNTMSIDGQNNVLINGNPPP
ncbi:hypothetical protein IMSHALPRED_000487 [Imshaugia aleurites]|uniref:Uncharacterized protein n=1 Tax=Imshaugia aleurites TaxID=172621 RepID=A0A8H3G6W9_9LECA|nr:hypothetical protein IMSHALPRED_000487 [Imshaugia aleurites]